MGVSRTDSNARDLSIQVRCSFLCFVSELTFTNAPLPFRNYYESCLLVLLPTLGCLITYSHSRLLVVECFRTEGFCALGLTCVIYISNTLLHVILFRRGFLR